MAELFAGDYLCLDYRANKLETSIYACVHEELEDFASEKCSGTEYFSVSRKNRSADVFQEAYLWAAYLFLTQQFAYS